MIVDTLITSNRWQFAVQINVGVAGAGNAVSGITLVETGIITSKCVRIVATSWERGIVIMHLTDKMLYLCTSTYNKIHALTNDMVNQIITIGSYPAVRWLALIEIHPFDAIQKSYKQGVQTRHWLQTRCANSVHWQIIIPFIILVLAQCRGFQEFINCEDWNTLNQCLGLILLWTGGVACTAWDPLLLHVLLLAGMIDTSYYNSGCIVNMSKMYCTTNCIIVSTLVLYWFKKRG